MQKDNKEKLPNVLVISTGNPFEEAGVCVYDAYKTLLNDGYDIDLITLYKEEGHPEFINILDEFRKPKTKAPKGGDGMAKRMLKGLWHLLPIEWRARIMSARGNNGIVQRPQYIFQYRKETDPMELEPVLLSKIQKPYDVVIVGGLYPIMNFRTMRTIYEKLKCQIHFFGGDYVFMTGGCHFTGDCLRYMTGCGKCPGIYSNDANDFTAFNAKYIKSVYEQTKPVFWCNTYMKSYFADKSYLLSGYDRIESVFLVIKMGTFKPMDRLPLLKKYGVPSDKRFVMLFGCNTLTDERKGVSYLKKALNTLYNRLSEEERKEVLFLTIGHDPEELVKAIPFDNQHLGFVPMKSLPEVYNLASVFLCPSVNDAGPSMVNQSLACGVPVIAFEMGTALDLVKDKGTGYCARLRDADDYADGIAKFMHMPQSEFEDCKRRCRSLAQEMTSEEAFSKRFKEMWEKYK